MSVWDDSLKWYQVGEMAGPTVCETRWTLILVSIERKHDDLIAPHPDCKEEIMLARYANNYNRSPCPRITQLKWERRGAKRADDYSRVRWDRAVYAP